MKQGETHTVRGYIQWKAYTNYAIGPKGFAREWSNIRERKVCVLGQSDKPNVFCRTFFLNSDEKIRYYKFTTRSSSFVKWDWTAAHRGRDAP